MQLSVRSCSSRLLRSCSRVPFTPRIPDPQLAQNLKRLSIEELTQLDITTASRRIEPLAQVAAAVSVIRGEDIRRAGVADPRRGAAAGRRHRGGARRQRHLGDQHARVQHQHRQQAPRADRRPHRLFAAVRRHVLVGAGRRRSPTSTASKSFAARAAPIWGANAVNGVVNIITKSAAETKGTAGRARRGHRRARHRDRAVRRRRRAVRLPRLRQVPRARRAGAREGRRAPTIRSSTGQGGVPARVARPASRDWLAGAGGRLRRARGAVRSRRTRTSPAANLMGRWGRRFSAGAQFRAQAYYDHVYRRVVRAGPRRAQHVRRRSAAAVAAGRHALVVGGGFRASQGDDTRERRVLTSTRRRASPRVAGVFAQDEIALVPATARRDRRIEVRAQHVHRRRSAAERPRAVDADGPPAPCGARCRARSACRRGSTPTCASPIRSRAPCTLTGHDRFRDREGDRVRGRIPRGAVAARLDRRRRRSRTSTTSCAARSSRPPPGSPWCSSNLMNGTDVGCRRCRRRCWSCRSGACTRPTATCASRRHVRSRVARSDEGVQRVQRSVAHVQAALERRPAARRRAGRRVPRASAGCRIRSSPRTRSSTRGSAGAHRRPGRSR